ncbi:MAG: ROK family glucokinase [Candidatus Sumerlaeia bacterium]|nr:ROK family glucokinase [Candidatus Sumerlaeia bacterium]
MKKVAIGIDVGGTKINAVAIDETGKILAKATSPTEASKGRAVAIRNILSTVKQIISLSQSKGLQPSGIGIGAPGPLNPETGIIIKAPNLPGWKNVPLRDIISANTDLPVVLENDANAAALGEYSFGAGKNSKVMLLLTLGTGVGGGIIIDGKIFSGANFIGAELGHTIIKFDGLKCPCGNYGCLEAYVSASAIVRRARMARGKKNALIKMTNNQLRGLTAKMIYEAAKSGDRFSYNIMLETGKLLGIGITSLANIFNPELIIIGGGVSQAGNMILLPARQEVRRRAMPGIAKSLSIIRAKLGEEAGAIGAACLILFNASKQRV